MKNWIANRRFTWIKKHGPCIQCGSWENLELHHKDPKQKVSHRIWSWSEERRLKELEKCVVLCIKCHGKTRKKDIPHGTNCGYNRHKCRCTICKKAHAEANKKYRNNKQ